MPSTRDFAFLGCRLLSLLALYWALEKTQFYILSVASSTGVSLIELLGGFLVPIMLALADVALFLLLWFGAGWISERMVSGMPDGEREADWSHSKVLALGVTVLGLVLVFVTVPRIAAYVFAFAFRGHIDPAGLVQVALMLIISVYCLVGAARIAEIVVKLRRW